MSKARPKTREGKEEKRKRRRREEKGRPEKAENLFLMS
jgi:hypothetical protein